jgi:rubrerythrin
MGTKSHRRARGRALSEDDEAVQDVEVQVDEALQPRSAPAPLPLDDSGFVDFRVAGTEVAGEFRCSDCGYGAVVHRALPPCPMCGGTVWESRPPRFPD